MLTTKNATLVTKYLHPIRNEAHAYLNPATCEGYPVEQGQPDAADPAHLLFEEHPRAAAATPTAASTYRCPVTRSRPSSSLSSTSLPSTSSPPTSPPPSHACTLAITRTASLSPTPSPRSSPSTRLSQLSAAVSPCPTSPAASRARRD
jgi:hypothetical protein